MELAFLLEDPLPDSKFDSHRWRRLFRLIVVHIKDHQKSYTLLSRMWTLRSAGMVMRRDLDGIKLTPLLEPEGAWPDMEFYESIREQYLTPYARELKLLIRMVEEQTE
ncbi:hypothetical protein RB620_04520 [Paenibacillus sp. LHD-117]|uniref:hypothetical protein n=1 Tax=Paenibacillus sp. LHD-117 TaxID=3071412 RepID=UPI0027E036C5|nr:hypothetical protein [Paenibacillus sp. LHD-117]MDQ6418697.1 hypothetical protein [Paenibacillus sp. LHD-117]